MQQPPSSSTVRIISLDREALLAQLRAIAAQIRRECDVEDVRVFGSLARGDATGTSDVDVLISCDIPLKRTWYDGFFPSCLILISIAEPTCWSIPGQNRNSNLQRRTPSCTASGARVCRSDTGIQNAHHSIRRERIINATCATSPASASP